MKEFSSEQRALLAFFLALIVLGVWGHFYKPPVPAHPQTQAPAKAPAKAPDAGPGGAAVNPGATAENPPRVSPAPETSAARVTAAPAKAIEGSSERLICIEGPLYRAVLSSRGGVVRSWQLKKYTDNQKPPHALDLVNAAQAQQLNEWPLSLVFDDAALEKRVNAALFRAWPGEDALRAPAEVRFDWSDGHTSVRKVLRFTADYNLEIQAEAIVDGRAAPVAIAWRGGFGDVGVEQAAQQVSVFYQEGGKLKLLPYKKLGVSGHPTERAQSGIVEYAGIQDQFFAAAFLPAGQPGTEPLRLWDWTEQWLKPGAEQAAAQPVAELAVGTASPGLNVRAYVGPKELSELSRQRPPLDQLIQFGYVGVIAKPLFEILKWIHGGVPNWGWAIVLLTLAINMALFPLKMKSWRSMQRMQRVMPQIEAIKQKYAKYSMRDPRKRKMNEEMMELYKKESINPMGGCLPMVLQMPIWWALYRMLQGAIELRHAPWLGWVHDLSARDPYYILPILMTITMYLMTKMTPQTASVDPAQQKMMSLMPVVFGIFFFRLSSGLVLYIFTSNLIGIAQQYYLNRARPLPARSKWKGKKTG